MQQTDEQKFSEGLRGLRPRDRQITTRGLRESSPREDSGTVLVDEPLVVLSQLLRVWFGIGLRIQVKLAAGSAYKL